MEEGIIMLIAFCGIDGSGKSTHVEFLAEWLSRQQLKVKRFKPINSDNDFLTYLQTIGKNYSDLYNEAMPREHRSILLAFELFQQSEAVKKWLAEDYIVVVDRWIYSHYAYAYARNIETKTLHAILDSCLKPDLVFLLDVPVDTSLQRIDERGPKRSMNESEAILEKARERFLQLKDAHQFILLNTAEPLDEIINRIQNEVGHRLKVRVETSGGI
ncbi:dTMP kinase [Paenibacillus macerans]|uniref:Thymidylate kinase n=2 Tax=Paenibacillus TaxID=44249 RepID=A0A6N8EYY3_PAEMA|nr:dTMP kinase [Paenibacillus macerans]